MGGPRLNHILLLLRNPTSVFNTRVQILRLFVFSVSVTLVNHTLTQLRPNPNAPWFFIRRSDRLWGPLLLNYSLDILRVRIVEILKDTLSTEFFDSLLHCERLSFHGLGEGAKNLLL